MGRQHPLTFSDVSGNDWFAQAVSTLSELRLIIGYEDGTFRPNNPITRAEFATIASRFAQPRSAPDVVFNDVPADHWAIVFIQSAFEYGWVTGDGAGNFRPEDNITRAEVVTLVNTMLDRLPASLPATLDNPYTDITPAHWAFIHIIEASIEHIYNRDDDGVEYWISYTRGGFLDRRDLVDGPGVGNPVGPILVPDTAPESDGSQ